MLSNYKMPIENKISKVIIDKRKNHGTIDGRFMINRELISLVNKHLKHGTAKKLVDTDETLMYELTRTESNIHPIFEQVLKPFMP